MPNIKKNRTGEKYMNNQGYEVEIIDYIYNTNCTIRFNDFRLTVLKNVSFNSISRGGVRNPYHPTVHGVGYLGLGEFSPWTDGKENRSYGCWKEMLDRGYSQKTKLKEVTYKDVTVDERWHNFQVFAKWFEENYVEGFHLDKDILVKGNKIYSPETCAFVPQEINSLFTVRQNHRGALPLGVIKSGNNFRARIGKNRKHIGNFKTPEEAFQAFKVEKELEIKRVADKWKHLIDPRVYKAMYEYQVEITD